MSLNVLHSGGMPEGSQEPAERSPWNMDRNINSPEGVVENTFFSISVTTDPEVKADDVFLLLNNLALY